MLNEFSRTELLIGKQGIERLNKASVAVFGVGGVGAYAVEALARAGIGKIALFDNDTVSLTNINRQLIAAHSTLGRFKTELARARVLDINPMAEVLCHQVFYTADNAGQFPLAEYDYVIDAIDTISSKLLLIENSRHWQVPVISCMGTGNKLNPTLFEVADIYQTSVCPLAKVMRRELKHRGIPALKVVYSKEVPIKGSSEYQETKGNTGRPVPGSISFVPPVAGMILAGEVVKDILKR